MALIVIDQKSPIQPLPGQIEEDIQGLREQGKEAIRPLRAQVRKVTAELAVVKAQLAAVT